MTKRETIGPLTTQEELDAINRRIANTLRTAIRKSGEPYSVVAAWAGTSEDSIRNYIRDDEKAQKIPLGRALLMIRRGNGFVRNELANLFIEIIGKKSPAADR